MTDQKEQDRKTLSLGGRGKLSLNKTGEGAQVRQSFSHGRSKTVQVEVKRKRDLRSGTKADLADGGAAARRAAEGTGGRGQKSVSRTLTEAEREARARVLRLNREEQARQPAPVAAVAEADVLVEEPEVEAVETIEPEAKGPLSPEELRQRELDELQKIEADEQRRKEEEKARADEIERQRREEEARRQAEEERRRAVGERSGMAAAAKVATIEEDDDRGKKSAPRNERRPAPSRHRNEPRRRGGKMTVTQALNQDEAGRARSLAAMRRRQERQRATQSDQPKEKIIRDVVVPEVITVQELANRMAERGADVIKTMMRMGVMATINQSIDADTAELIVEEFGHKIRRVSESDVELGLRGSDDETGDLKTRPPVVTIMGHVDHGKTSLLDALRKTNVVSGEAGGITQHIGAYQVTAEDGNVITFIDTPGHEAFTAMRARGANTTDIVILVVAADDAVMPQTVEAIRHAKAAEVPIIVAINKVDLPDANPQRVREALLQHEVVVEQLGGEVQDVEVSAKTGQGLDDLLEAISLQAEVLELTANPDRPAEGSVIEAKLERGRGSVATVLVQRGTLRGGDIFVTGSEWGRVRALIDDHGDQIDDAGPSKPVEVLGLQGTPLAGDDFVVVPDEARAREIADYRDRKKREAAQVAGSRGTLEQMFAQAQKGEVKALPVVIKADVQGSAEAIDASLAKLVEDNEELDVRVLHSAVGAVNESDVTLAASTGALIIGFNVRANPQARDAAKRDGVEIRYYGVIYDVIDDVRNALSGLLAPTLRENFIGNAEIREVFQITRVGKVAGCMVTDGIVRRGAGVRLLRDSVVIHEGKLKTLKRFKDEVREVREGYECGMAFENYDDIRQGDVIEAFEVEEVQRDL